jgi:hypothetical protein
MKLTLFFTSLFAALLGVGMANAGEPVKDTGAMACFTDKWDTKEPEKGHKLVDYAGRCVLIPDDTAEPSIAQDCTGNTNTCRTKAGRLRAPASITIQAAISI